MIDREIVRILLNAGADYTLVDGKKQNILLITMAFQDIPMIDIILQHDAKTSLEIEEKSILCQYDNTGRSMLYLSCCQNNINITQKLLEFIPDIQINRRNIDADRQTPLFAAISRCDVPLVTYLLSLGADPNLPDNSGYYYYHYYHSHHHIY